MLRGWVASALVAASASTASAGQAAAPPDQPLLGLTMSAEMLRDLPTSNNPFAALEVIPEAIADRFSSGGLNVATAPRFGAFLNSWTQTQFRIGDVTITDPRAGGTPLLLPSLAVWQRMTVPTGAMGADENASGVSMTLDPLRPGTRWFRAIDASASGTPFVSAGTGPVPVVDRAQRTRDGSVLVSGPVSPRLGVVAAGSWRGLSHIAAPSIAEASDGVASGFAHVVFAATARDEIRALGWAQRVAAAAFTDNGVHLQSTWERRDPALAWRVFGGYTGRSRTAPVTPTLLVDSLASEPVSNLIDAGAGTERRWVLGARVTPAASRFVSSAGIDIEGAQIRIAPSGTGQIRELVDGVPARLWTLRTGSAPDIRHLTTFDAYAIKHLTSGRLTVDLGLRLDAVSGAADAASSAPHAVRWTTWLPAANARWRLADTAGLALVAGYRRTAYQMPLNLLAIGDPAAPVADVSVWNGTSTGSLIARVGPGTGGDATFAQIDPQLRRPTTDELVLALQAHPFRGIDVQLARITKREQPLFGFVNTGVDASQYTSFQVPDPSFLPGSDDGGPLVTVYNRPPGSYGRDRYLLTNQTGEAAKSWGAELSVRATTARLMLIAGTTLTWADGQAAAPGFLPTENDQVVVGGTYADPNDATNARGQLFQDRSHTVKIAATYQFPWGVRLGAIARYQDGQPFSRLVIVPGLTQGTTAVRSYPNGGTAFTYTGTLDVRVQKVIAAGAAQTALVLDVYNLPNLGKEVSEYVVSGAAFRAPTALQPPRTAVVGLRVTF